MTRITRRTFIEGSVATGLVLAGGRYEALAAGPDIVDVRGLDQSKMVAAAFAGLGGIERIVSKGDYVVIKPNAAFANPPEWATTTHPKTVVAVAQQCLKAGAKRVTVVEFPQAKGKKCLDRCGLTEALAEVPEVQIKVLAGKGDFKKVKVPGGKVLKETEIAKLALSADVVVNVPAAKQHGEAVVSLGMKNAMGLIYDRKSFHTVFDLQQGVADLARVIKPQVTLVDATRALLTAGPAGPGETSEPGRIVAGLNVTSVDAYALTVARFNNRELTPDDARHIKLAGEAGLGEIDIARMRVKKVSV